MKMSFLGDSFGSGEQLLRVAVRRLTFAAERSHLRASLQLTTTTTRRGQLQKIGSPPSLISSTSQSIQSRQQASRSNTAMVSNRQNRLPSLRAQPTRADRQVEPHLLRQ